ncbi:MAG: metallophosphoesterase family protein [Bacteroidota bacterium]
MRLAVVSDLHCHSRIKDQSPDTFLLSDLSWEPKRDNPVASLIDLLKLERIKADVLLVPGDLTNKIERQGLVSGWEHVGTIAQSLGNPLIACTVGNHDVDSTNIHKKGPFDLPQRLHPDYPVRSEKAKKDFWQDGFCFIEKKHLRILIVNTVKHHHSEPQAKRGEIDDAQLEMLEERLNKLKTKPKKPFQIALLHHHPMLHSDNNLGTADVLERGDVLLDLLDRFGYQLVVHGHKHFPKLRYGHGGASPPLVFAAGSLSAVKGEMLSNTRNLFHVIEITDDTIEYCWYPGIIRSWEFNKGHGWNSPNRRSASFPSISGFGYRGNYRDLASSTAAVLKTKKVPIDWADLVAVLPQLSYLVPHEFEEFGNYLKTQFSMKLSPEPPDVPQFVGYMNKGSR